MSVNLRSDKQERDYQMAKKTNRQSIRKPPAILPRIVILLFLLMMLLFMNLDSVSHLLNYGSYEKVTAKVVRPSTDDFLLLIPMAEIQYSYKDVTYTEEQLFILQPLFGLSREPGDTLSIYVNTYAPNHCLIKVNFFRNPVNWLLLALIALCITDMIRRIKKKQTYRTQKGGLDT